jgi:hypothetical protein
MSANCAEPFLFSLLSDIVSKDIFKGDKGGDVLERLINQL